MARKVDPVTAGNTITAGWGNATHDEAEASSRLLAYGDTNALKVFVSPGLAYFGRDDVITFAGGASALFTDPSASNRVDVVTLESSNVLKVVVGVEDDTPAVPAIPDGEIPICEVFLRSGGTQVDDTDQASGNGYIQKDLRPVVVELGTSQILVARAKLTATSTLLLAIDGIDSGFDMFIIRYWVVGGSADTSSLRMELGTANDYDQQFVRAKATTVDAEIANAQSMRLAQGDIASTTPASGECIVLKPLAAQRASMTGSSRENNDTSTTYVGYGAQWSNTSEKISQINVFVIGDGWLEVGSYISVEGVKSI